MASSDQLAGRASVQRNVFVALWCSDARANAEALKDPKTLAVVTGQQSVLFGGPLYVLYKALAAMELARTMSESLKTKVVPVFWVASDDHDFAEIRATTMMDGNTELKALRYEPAEEPKH